MGYRLGGPFGSIGINNVPDAARNAGLRVKNEAHFTSSYHATFSRQTARASPASGDKPLRSAAVSSLTQIGPGTAKGGESLTAVQVLSRSRSESSIRPESSTRLEAARSLRVEGRGPAAEERRRAPELRGLRPGASRGAAEQRRKTLEMLANPNLRKVAQDMFNSHEANKDGRLEFNELCSVLRALHNDLDIPSPDTKVAERLFKKFDVNGDQSLTFREFFELFKGELRRSAFNRSSVISREFFITKNTDKVWSVYSRAKELGAGSFGKAYLATHKASGEHRVVKAVQKSRTSMPLDEIEQEILIMRQIDHPHIVRLFEWYEDSNNFYLVLEALQGGTLKEVLLVLEKRNREIKEAWTHKVLCQVVEAMAFVHSLRLIHKDLKDENIMLLRKDPNFDEPFAIVIDLGIAEMFSAADPIGREMGGTPTTMAPEVWAGSFGPKCDVFSLGCILYQLLSGCYPFMAQSLKPQAWIRLHKKGPDWSKVRTSKEGRDLCQRMLTFSERDRPSMAECRAHPYFDVDQRQLKAVPAEQLRQFSSFCHSEALKRSLLLEIAARLPMDRSGEVINMFETLDSDFSGNVSTEELNNYFQRMGIEDRELIEATFSALDVNQDGKLSFSEFAAGALLIFKDMLEERLRTLFRKHDFNNNGALDVAEAKDFLDDVQAAIDRESSGVSSRLLHQLMDDAEGGLLTYEQLRQYIAVPVSASPSPSRLNSVRSSHRSSA